MSIGSQAATKFSRGAISNPTQLGAASHHVLECTQVACFWKDTFQVAIYPNTPSDLIAEHVAYIKNREWLDVRIPAE